jgi:hypothetical protein
MLKNEVLPVTANARMAPRQMNPRAIPVLMDAPFLAVLGPPI